MSLDITPAEAFLASPETAEPIGLSDRTLWVMATACGTAAANIYYNQPLLGNFANYFHATDAQAGMVATAAQVGYGVGIFFFVPLGDLMERRRLVLLLTAACALVLMFTAAASSLTALVFFQLLVGITAMGAQVLIPLAVDLSAAERRGHTVGILMGGLLMGILLARTVSGFLGDLVGWRATYMMSAGVMGIMWFVLRASLPHRAPSLRMSYARLMHSMWDLLITQPKLWTASAVSALTFASFAGFWTTLSFLMKVKFDRGAKEAGMFGIIGVAGALAAPIAGKLSDKRGPGFTVFAAVLSSIAAFALMGLRVSIPSLIFGVLLMDMGVQSVQVAEQATVMSLVPDARSRMNTMYMVARFMGGAGGSALCALMWSKYRWTGVCSANVVLLAVAMGVHAAGTIRKSNDEIRMTTNDKCSNDE
jgi:predicted MFS family arabinose efflux permease